MQKRCKLFSRLHTAQLNPSPVNLHLLFDDANDVHAQSQRLSEVIADETNSLMLQPHTIILHQKRLTLSSAHMACKRLRKRF